MLGDGLSFVNSKSGIIMAMNIPLPLEKALIVRDNAWLAYRLNTIWKSHFADIDQDNEVRIVFGRKSRARLGSIGMHGWQGADSRKREYRSRYKDVEGTSIITITGYFKDPRVPEYVIDATIAHEVVHYVHGFHSPRPQLYTNPHAGGVVDKEMIERGLGDTLAQQKRWLKDTWLQVVDPPKRRKRRVIRLSFLHPYCP